MPLSSCLYKRPQEETKTAPHPEINLLMSGKENINYSADRQWVPLESRSHRPLTRVTSPQRRALYCLRFDGSNFLHQNLKKNVPKVRSEQKESFLREGLTRSVV